MVFADKKYFTREHFEKNSGYAPPYLCELVVYCLELLSNLAHRQLNFRFKGGNSLLLILDKPLRFSIDVDIATSEKKEKLISIAEEIRNQSEVFTRLEIRQHKTKPWLPMISFKIYFDSFFQSPDDSYVMLDAVLKPAPSEGYVSPIRVEGIYQSSENVEVSTPAGLIGDKLLTIGPSTLGIPIGKNKEAQRLKHVFDISQLSKFDIEVEKVRKSVLSCMKQENEIQRSSYKLPEVIEDTVVFCEKPLKYDEIPDLEQVEDDDYLFEIVKGFEDFKKHLFSIEYTWDMLKDDMKRVRDVVVSLR